MNPTIYGKNNIAQSTWAYSRKAKFGDYLKSNQCNWLNSPVTVNKGDKITQDSSINVKSFN